MKIREARWLNQVNSTTLALLTAGTMALASAFALADGRTLSDVTPAEQARMKQEANAEKVAFASMTPAERAEMRKTVAHQRLEYLDTLEKLVVNPKETRNSAINKTAAASKAGPTPPRGWINTPEGNEFLMKQKGQ
jgi:long-subunit fatty acid transport protein